VYIETELQQSSVSIDFSFTDSPSNTGDYLATISCCSSPKIWLMQSNANV